MQKKSKKNAKKMQKNITTYIIIMFNLLGYAQTSGIGTSNPNPSSILEVLSPDKGLLIPRVNLTSTLDTITITNGNVNSLLVFNTSSLGDVTPGFYYWYSNRWYKLITSSNNGLSVINGAVELGGTLTKPTLITSSATNTLAIPGLPTGASSDQVLVTDATTGVVKKIASASLIPATTVDATVLNGALTTTVNGVSDSTPVNVLTSSNNGITATNGLVQFGGTLIKPTVINTSSTNTLAISDLETTIENSSDIPLVIGIDGVLRKGLGRSISRAAYTTPIIAPGQSYTINLIINPQFSTFVIGTNNACGRTGIATFTTFGDVLSFLGGQSRNLLYSSTILDIDGKNVQLKTSGITISCGDGGDSSQFDFDISKSGRTIILTNRGNINRFYYINQSEL